MQRPISGYRLSPREWRHSTLSLGYLNDSTSYVPNTKDSSRSILVLTRVLWVHVEIIPTDSSKLPVSHHQSGPGRQKKNILNGAQDIDPNVKNVRVREPQILLCSYVGEIQTASSVGGISLLASIESINKAGFWLLSICNHGYSSHHEVFSGSRRDDKYGGRTE